MPSPFPGMDPYLEHSSTWHAMHVLLIAKVAESLQPRLKSRGYFADVAERVWLVQSERSVEPDVAVVKVPRPQSPNREATSVAVAEPDEPIRLPRSGFQVREPYIDIYEASGNRLVTSIEVISPKNKQHSLGRDLYRKKQQELADAGIHLVEIDLLRSGQHIIDFPEEMLSSLPRWDYLINLVRRGSDEYEIYSVRIRDPLPNIRIPLSGSDDDETLILQDAFDQAYDAGPFSVSIDYREPPHPRLAEDDVAWASERVTSRQPGN